MGGALFMREIEFKNFGFEVKATSDNTFEGYASIFDNIDAGRDIMEKGAFTKTLQESQQNRRVKFLWQHDPLFPIGKPTHMSEDSKGLHVKGFVAPTQLGKDAMILMKEGVLDELSIGYNAIKDEWDSKQNVRRLKEVKLWEFSLVTFAMNEQAQITAAKNIFGQADPLKNAFALMEELKAGKVLSDKNKGLVVNAIDALQALLSATEKGAEPLGGTPKPIEVDEKAANDILAILQNMKELSKK